MELHLSIFSPISLSLVHLTDLPLAQMSASQSVKGPTRPPPPYPCPLARISVNLTADWLTRVALPLAHMPVSQSTGPSGAHTLADKPASPSIVPSSRSHTRPHARQSVRATGADYRLTRLSVGSPTVPPARLQLAHTTTSQPAYSLTNPLAGSPAIFTAYPPTCFVPASPYADPPGCRPSFLVARSPISPSAGDLTTYQYTH